MVSILIQSGGGSWEIIQRLGWITHRSPRLPEIMQGPEAIGLRTHFLGRLFFSCPAEYVNNASKYGWRHLLFSIILFGEQSQSAWLTSLTPAWYALLLHVHGRFALADWNKTFISLLLTLLLCWFVMWCCVMWCYAVSRMVTSSRDLQVFIFQTLF